MSKPPPGGPAGGNERAAACGLRSGAPILAAAPAHGAASSAITLPRGVGPSRPSKIPRFASGTAMARSSTTPKEPASYEQAVNELDQLVQRMEAGQLPLDQLLESYRRGADLLAWCRQRLQAVEEQVKQLEDGRLEAWPTA
ncbi:hypothetical protein MASR1M6_32460 [Rubrivivax sp.]